jgi:hypothetical protein
VRLGDALDDCQAEADAGVVGADSFAAAKERLVESGDHLRGELLAAVLDAEHRARGSPLHPSGFEDTTVSTAADQL